MSRKLPMISFLFCTVLLVVTVTALQLFHGQLASKSGHRTIDYNSLAATIQPIPYPLQYLPFKSIALQYRDKDVVLDYVKDLIQVQVNYIGWSSLVYWCQQSIVESHWIGQVALGEAMPSILDHLLV